MPPVFNFVLLSHYPFFYHPYLTLNLELLPTGDYGDRSNDDAVLFAAQSFARLDAEEEADGESEASS